MTDPTPTEPYAPPAGRFDPDAPRDPGVGTGSASTRGDRVAGRAGPSTGDVVFGLAFLAVGLWLFADVTLGLELPRVRWAELWPLAIIAIGLWILVGALRRR